MNPDEPEATTAVGTPADNDEPAAQDTGSKALIIVLVITIGLILLFLSIRFFYHPATQESYSYNGFTFVKTSGLWVTELQMENRLYTIPTRYAPQELEDITVPRGSYETVLAAERIYLSVPRDYNPRVTLAAVELGNILGMRYGILNKTAQGAMTTPGNDTLPVKTCEDAGNGDVVILFKLGNETGIYSFGDCIVLSGATDWDVVRAADRLIFTLLRIMS